MRQGCLKNKNTYGKHLLGGNHSRIEAPYIQYNSETGYYYLFTSFGGLDANGATTFELLVQSSQMDPMKIFKEMR